MLCYKRSEQLGIAIFSEDVAVSTRGGGWVVTAKYIASQEPEAQSTRQTVAATAVDNVWRSIYSGVRSRRRDESNAITGRRDVHCAAACL